ncbi:hypothetical protein PS914_04854 [Pseudomonas fluorescens]|uniref:RHS repeat-associated core domain-containing protein n=1 Tax=Pseudomonas fluorescens TaxID=294 RepID=UPI001242CB0A|nr:RHS repeat-associated core domain-containing protein [Pseudomonas fluorescens]VVQ08391.1 hypothetical protein PS914_04854 [Pseudomonas fluorescens]
MSTSSLKILCRYQYDPLDRLTGVGLLERASTQRFYQEDHLTTELGEQTQRTIFRHEAQPLAQQQSTAGVTETKLLATDQAHSVLHTLAETNPQQLAYTAYGHHPAESGLSRLLGFNGECPEEITGHYLLGHGTRAFNPVLMRFNSPDELSPFGEGGINCYTYCEGDPINFKDPTGNVRVNQLFQLWNSIKPKIFQPWKQNLKALDLSSTGISRPRHTARNPTRLSTSVTASAPQPRPSTSTLASQDVLYPYKLPDTQINPRQNSLPKDGRYQDLLDDAVRYDKYKNSNTNYTPVTSHELLEKAKKYTKAANQSERTTPALTIIKAKQSLRRTEMEIKRYNIRKIDNNSAS